MNKKRLKQKLLVKRRLKKESTNDVVVSLDVLSLVWINGENTNCEVCVFEFPCYSTVY